MNNKKYSFGTIIIFGIGFVSMLGISLIDQKWTLYLMDHRWKYFTEFMRRNIPDDGVFGGADPGNFYFLAAIVLYLYSNSRFSKPSLQNLSCLFGFITSTVLIVSGIVTTLKWSIGRARPHEVFSDGIEYSNWYEFGSYYIGNEIFFGSFPSGHTATMSIFITLAYILIGDPILSKKWQVFGWVCGGFILCSIFAMILGRVMAKHHWISDGFGSLIIVWGVTHFLYYWGLKIPKQRLYFHNEQQQPTLLRFWELRLSGYFILLTLSIGLTLIALNSFRQQEPPLLAVLAIIGIPLLIFAIERGLSIYQKVHKNFVIE